MKAFVKLLRTCVAGLFYGAAWLCCQIAHLFDPRGGPQDAEAARAFGDTWPISTLLLLFFCFQTMAGVPELPAPAARLVLVEPSHAFLLTWSNSPAGCSNVIWYGAATDAMTNSFYAGATNALPVSAPLTRTYFQVEPLHGDLPRQRSNVVGVPARIVGQVWPEYSSAVYPEGQWQWESLSGKPIATFIHSGGEPGFVYRLRIAQTNDYAP